MLWVEKRGERGIFESRKGRVVVGEVAVVFI